MGQLIESMIKFFYNLQIVVTRQTITLYIVIYVLLFVSIMLNMTLNPLLLVETEYNTLQIVVTECSEEANGSDRM